MADGNLGQHDSVELLRSHGRRPKIADLQNQLRHNEILLNVSRRVSGTESLDEILDALVEETTSRAIGADRSSFFLFDPNTNELFSRSAQGIHRREIRFASDDGIGGAVFQSREALIVDDAYADPRFHADVDKETGYVTKNILCVPIRTVKDEVIGVAQCLNKLSGQSFNEDDQNLLMDIAQMAVPALRSSQFVERMRKVRAQEMEFLSVVADITSELELDSLLARVMAEATRMLDAERSTLFLHDDKTDTLFSRVAQGDKVGEIRLPSHAGIAGTDVFTTNKTVNIPHAYADLRFNPGFDKTTGFFTRSILCTPVVNKYGKVIGVTQALNKRGGPFSDEDESRLKAFTAQVAIALDNAKLFDDVQKMKNYNESMLLSMAIQRCGDAQRRAGRRDLQPRPELKLFQCKEADIIGKKASDFFTGKNEWIVERLDKVQAQKTSDIQMDVALQVGDQTATVNFSVLPLKTDHAEQLGTMLMIEDILDREAGSKATMARYMDPTIAARMLENDDGGMLEQAARPHHRHVLRTFAASPRSPSSWARKGRFRS